VVIQHQYNASTAEGTVPAKIVIKEWMSHRVILCISYIMVSLL